MKTLVILGIALALVSLTASASQAQLSPAPSSPSNSVQTAEQWVPTTAWEYHAMDTIEKAGIRFVWPDYITVTGPIEMTRNRFATSIIRLVPVIDTAAGGENKLSPLGQQMATSLRDSRPAIMALRSLTAEFAPEIKQMGQDPVAIETRLASMLSAAPFPDVPKDHWAYNAVQALRTAGIVIGYQDGTN